VTTAPAPTFELGPIRPPSEARSLLVRVTRGCPHHRCAFCSVYQGLRFSIRSRAEVLADLDAMAEVAAALRRLSEEAGRGGLIDAEVVRAAHHGPLGPGAIQIAAFLATGGRHAFLQDANSLVMPPGDLAAVLERLRERFPSVARVTSYARAHTLTRRTPEQLSALRQRGLDRVHVGLESGSDRVLALVQKGALAARQIEAGHRAKAAGMELSEYVMPGLGGRALSREHALETARVLSAIDPHFIRLRTTAAVPGTGLHELVRRGELEPLSDEEVVAEVRLLLEHLEVSSRLQSDHTLNLLPELQGRLPEDRGRMLAVIDRFQALPPRLRRAFVAARRAGQVLVLDELDEPAARERALALLGALEARHGEALDEALRAWMVRSL